MGIDEWIRIIDEIGGLGIAFFALWVLMKRLEAADATAHRAQEAADKRSADIIVGLIGKIPAATKSERRDERTG